MSGALTLAGSAGEDDGLQVEIRRLAEEAVAETPSERGAHTTPSFDAALNISNPLIHFVQETETC